ncbi:hypothetical protein [Lactococcus lactis]|uniref:hypothetical protein n=1 Tax=Lactococcus lactis TaxID=1358 RepID=UPI00211D7A90|nr:hypothetical protein [Lactococcus lactis]MDG4972496.1 hypothetical protein [Lactococcus lactis]
MQQNLVLHLLNQSFSNQLQIKVKYQSKDKLTEVYGFVSEFINNQVRLKSTDKIYLISIEQIKNIS